MGLAHFAPFKFAMLSAFFKFESKFNRPNERLNLKLFSLARQIRTREICALFGIVVSLGFRTSLDLIAKVSQA